MSPQGSVSVLSLFSLDLRGRAVRDPHILFDRIMVLPVSPPSFFHVSGDWVVCRTEALLRLSR